MTDFLLELRCEEIPARMQAGARAELEKLFRAEMAAAGITQCEVTVWSTPRRLALIAHGLQNVTASTIEDVKGPPADAPDTAIEGFLRKHGLLREALQTRDIKGRSTLFVVTSKQGRPTIQVLAEAIPAIIRGFAWPKSMRWGTASLSTESLRWVRPLSGIVAILGEELVECAVDGITSGYATLGHRFHCPGEITIGGVDDYQEKLRACHVIVDHEERAALIRDGARKVAEEAGLTLVEDEGLVVENAGLTEWPVPLLGRFDEAFLDVPPEVIQLTARVNQKYFVCISPSPLQGRGRSAKGAKGVGNVKDSPHPPTPSPKEEGESLANAFICTANITAADPAVVVDGNRKVLAARLADARFFWEQDRKTTLAEHAKKLERITFHEKLGTVADKVERVAKLARWLCEEGVILPGTGRGTSEAGGGARATGATSQGSSTPPVPLHHPAGGPPPPVGEDRARLADLAEQAARLCKADLVTEMVGEFPELQGVMGGYYARAEDLPDEVADAIRDHYKPVGQGDEVPSAPVTVAVSLADKLDTLVGFFASDEKPTGSKDPFALRRAALAVIQLIESSKLSFGLMPAFEFATDRALEDAGSFQHTQRKQKIKAAAGDGVHLMMGGTPRLIVSSPFGSYEQKFSSEAHALLDFFADRLKVQQREAGVRHDLIDAVFALGGEDDLVRLLARVHALQSFIGTEDGTNLLAGYKRAANILKKEGWTDTPSPLQGRGRSPEGAEGVGDGGSASPNSPHPPTPSPEGEGEIWRTGDEDPLENVDDPQMREIYAELYHTHEPAEAALIEALDAAEPRAITAIEAEDFSAAMSALASLRAPIDRFFDEVTVNAPQEDVRASRLNLLARFRAAVHKVADFSQIEG